MEWIDDDMRGNARELPKLWEMIDENLCPPRNINLNIIVSDKDGKQATFTINHAQIVLLSLIKVTVTRALMKATKTDNIHEVVDKYSN